MEIRTKRIIDDGDDYDRLEQYDRLADLFDKTETEKDYEEKEYASDEEE